MTAASVKVYSTNSSWCGDISYNPPSVYWKPKVSIRIGNKAAVYPRVITADASDMQRFKAAGHSAFVLGYSGLAGKALALELNKMKLFKKVVLIGRREIPLDVGPEFEQKVVNFDKIDDHKDIFQDLDVGFCCLGVPSGGGISKEDYVRITLDYVVASAQIAKEQGCKHFTVVTGQGTKKNSWFLFGRVKAELEETLEKMNFDRLSIFRPALILGPREESKSADTLARVFFKPLVYLFPTLLSVPDETLAKAMINNAVVHPSQPTKEIYENKKIHELAKFNIENAE